MRTWKMEGPPEMVEGIVMKVMTSCSLRPARRARNRPIDWMASCELVAMRIMASRMFDILGGLPFVSTAVLASLMIVFVKRLQCQRTPAKVSLGADNRCGYTLP